MAKTATITAPMPTPFGHAVGGLAVAWFAESAGARRRVTLALSGVCATIAMLPDIDILFDSHRTYAHSAAAVAAVGIIAWIALRGRTRSAARVALVIAAAYGSHLLLDWLGKDSSQPPGLMALWPFSPRFYVSGLDLFGEVSRRYWKPEEFIIGNLKAVAWELLILGPVAGLAWFLRTRTLAKSPNHFPNSPM